MNLNHNYPTAIEGYKDPKDLAAALSGLRYDALEKYFAAMHIEFNKAAKADDLRKRPKLALKLRAIAIACKMAYSHANMAWKICKAFMKN